MAKVETVSYEVFAKACRELDLQGVKPTIRLVRDKVGGSNTTLVAHMRTWKEASTVQQVNLRELPLEVVTAISAALSRVDAEARAQVHDQLASAQTDLDDLAANNERLETQLQEALESLEQVKARCGLLEHDASSQAAELSELRASARAEQVRAESARVDLARAELRVESAEARLRDAVAAAERRQAELQARQSEMQSRESELVSSEAAMRASLAQAKDGLAVAETRASVLEAQMKAESAARAATDSRLDAANQSLAVLEGAAGREAAANAKAAELERTVALLREMLNRQSPTAPQ